MQLRPGRRQPRRGRRIVKAVQLLVDGLRFGLLIAICAVGLSLIFGTTGLTNFAHGELVTIGAVIAWYINVRLGVPLIPATLIAMVVGAAVGALNELGLWRPLRRRGTGLIAALVVSIGLSLALRYLIQIVFGGRLQALRRLPEPAGRRLRRCSRMTNRTLASIVISRGRPGARRAHAAAHPDRQGDAGGRPTTATWPPRRASTSTA